jgi:SNF2 family DNA or RNA helicase
MSSAFDDFFDDFLNDVNDMGTKPEEYDEPAFVEPVPSEPVPVVEIPAEEIPAEIVPTGEFAAERDTPDMGDFFEADINFDEFRFDEITFTSEDVTPEKGEVFEGEVFEGEVVEDTDSPDANLSPLQQAMLEVELLSIQLEQEFSEEQEYAIRRKINEAQKILDGYRAELDKFRELRRGHRNKIREAETRVSEEEHREAERQREKEISERRNSAMMVFKNRIEEVNPAWKQYAFQHQWDGAANLALHEGGLLADEMGLGKTLTTIMVPDMAGYKLNLVVTPADTNSNFTLEYAQWSKHRWVWTLAGADKATRKFFMGLIKGRVDNGEDVTLLINYEQLYTDMEYFDELLNIPWDAIFIDEFHNAKNSKGLLFNRLRSFRNKGVKHFFPITGTFILNSPDDIWPALHLVDPEAFPAIRDFREQYCTQNWDNKWVFRTGGEASLLARLGGRITKRSMEDAGIKLPKQHIHFVDLEFGDGYFDQRRVMKQLAEHSQIILDSERKASITAQIALITRQRQAAIWPAGIVLKYTHPDTLEEITFSVGDEVQESIKLDWIMGKIQELRAQGKRVVIFSQFKTALAELERRILELKERVVRYDGDTPKEIRAKVKQDFDRKHVEITGEWAWDIVLCNYKTGGVGLNFTHATDMIIADEEWNPGKNEQAYKRIRRMGQTEETHVWIPQLRNSIDEWMREINEQKRNIIEGFDSQVDLSQELSDFFNKVKDLY